MVARRAHNPKVVGSSPAPATRQAWFQKRPGFFILKTKRGVVPLGLASGDHSATGGRPPQQGKPGFERDRAFSF